MNATFKNQVICITGASSGIGEALLRELAKNPCTLFIAARSVDKLESLKQELSNEQVKIHVLNLDLANAQSIEAAAEELKKNTDRLDLLINNGGISQRGKAIETEFSVVRQIMEVNFMGCIHWTSTCMPLLNKSKEARIIVTSSVVGHYGFPLRSAYAASKHALQGYFESMQLESEAPHVSIISPGRIQTDISMHALDASGKAHGEKDPGQLNGIPAKTAAKKILEGSLKKKKDIFIGRGEIFLIYLHRYLPFLFRIIAKKVSAT